MTLRTLCRLVLTCAIAAPGAGVAQPRSACAVLTAQEAASLMGASLPEAFKGETPPDAQNGHDHTTVCGWFPKGYKLATADGPPERGIQLSLHTFRTPAEAKTFHTNIAEMVQEAAKSSPIPGKFSRAAGVGEAAQLEQKQLAGVHLTTLRFLKGKVAAQLQVWRKDGPSGDTATAAGKKLAGML